MTAAATEPRSAHVFAWPKVVAVLVIVGLLAAIAVPLYLDQVKKSHDATVTSDLNSVADGIVAAVSEGQTEAPSLVVSGAVVTLDGETIATLSPGVVLGELEWDSADKWCIDATDPDGKHAASPGYKFEGPDGDTKTGQCS